MFVASTARSYRSYIGRGEKIRTSDPHNPIVVRYQAALRPDRVPKRNEGGNDTCRPRIMEESTLAAQDLQYLLQFQSHLLDNLLALADIRLGLIARESLSGAADRKSVVIQQTSESAELSAHPGV